MQISLDRAVSGTVPGSAQRMRALATVRWILATEDHRFVTVDAHARASLTDELTRATIYDGRDNEALKARFMQVLLGVPLTVVLIDE